MKTTFPYVEFDPALVDGVGKIDGVLTEFLDVQKDLLQDKFVSTFPNADPMVIGTVLQSLVTWDGLGEATKKPMKLEEIVIADVTQDELKFILKELEDRRIVRVDEDTYELAHDTLAAHIHSQRDPEELALLKAVSIVQTAIRNHETTGAYLSNEDVRFVRRYREQIVNRESLNPGELAFLKTSERKMRKREYGIRAIVAIVVLAAFAISLLMVQSKNSRKLIDDTKELNDELVKTVNLNQILTFEGYERDADASLAQLRPGDAVLKFQLARNMLELDTAGILPDRKDILDSLIDHARSQALLENAFNAHIQVADNHISSGAYRDAIQILQDADSLDYNDAEVLRRRNQISPMMATKFYELKDAADAYYAVGDKYSLELARDTYRNALAYRDNDDVRNKLDLCLIKLAQIE